MIMYQISRKAVEAAKKQAGESAEYLRNNTDIMNNEVYSILEGLTDPIAREYMSLSEELERALHMVNDKLDQLQDYCGRVIAWMDEFEN